MHLCVCVKDMFVCMLPENVIQWVGVCVYVCGAYARIFYPHIYYLFHFLLCDSLLRRFILFLSYGSFLSLSSKSTFSAVYSYYFIYIPTFFFLLSFLYFHRFSVSCFDLYICFVCDLVGSLALFAALWRWVWSCSTVPSMKNGNCDCDEDESCTKYLYSLITRYRNQVSECICVRCNQVSNHPNGSR